MNRKAPSWQSILIVGAAAAALVVCCLGETPEAQRPWSEKDWLALLERRAEDRSPAAEEAFGNALSSDAERIRMRAVRWLKDGAPEDAVGRRTLYHFRSWDGRPRQVDVQWGTGSDAFGFLYWVVEDGVEKTRGGEMKPVP